MFTGITSHSRHAPRPHAFQYRLFWLGIDLDELASLDKTLAGFGHNRFALASIHDRDYCGPGEASIIEKLRPRLDHAGMEQPHRVTLMTVPRILGYVFNPVSFYLLKRPDDSLVGMVAEVRNTFGESHLYVLRPDQPAKAPDDVVHFAFAKRFYVSPFLDRRGEYRVALRTSDDHFDINVTLQQDGCAVFTARMHGAGRVLSAGAFWRTLARFPLHAASVMLKIHWQAFLLRFFRNAPLYAKPAPLAGETAAAGKRSIWHILRTAAVARGREADPLTHRGSQTMSTGTHTP